ncbi:hypothetical protein [Kribbella sp. CA-247076]|uniref:hypothetical protein n=1 Tax=Kribbella sp. CA-247076 TaxID=3239941 RepID=UPI003D8C8611
MKLFSGWPGASHQVHGSPTGADSGPVILLLDDGIGTQESLEWAAAEAAARGSELRIVTGGRVRLLVNEARRSDGALVVLGRGRNLHRLEPALARRLIRRTSASLAVIGCRTPGCPPRRWSGFAPAE